MLEGRNFIGIEKNENVALFKKKSVDYIEISKFRILEALDSIKKNQQLFSNLELVNLLKENCNEDNN